MTKYQVVVLRQLKGFGQFVTESRDEVNTYEFGEGDERPIIFGEKLKAVERRTIMRKVREVLKVNCWLTTHKKGGDGGISGLCMSCPACALFGGTYAPKKGGGAGPRNVVEMRRAYYSGAFPFQGGGIRDVTFNAVDERTGQTGQALGTNQIIEPRDFVDVVTVEAENENWVKLLVWGIEHSDRYGANTRIYGEVHNEVLGVVVDTRLRIAAIDLARLKPGATATACIKKHLDDEKLALTPMKCADSEIDTVINGLTKDEAVEDLARRKNSVDVSVEEYLEKTAVQLNLKLPAEKKDGKEAPAWKKWKVGERLEFLTGKKKSQYELARDIEKANFAEPEDVEDEVAK
jgi:CRISPR type I-D-associated protein Csc2